MPSEDQEHVEDYLELERYIAELQAGRIARLPETMTPEQARLYRMAMLFHAASSNAGEPSPHFVSELEARLRSESHDIPSNTSSRFAHAIPDGNSQEEPATLPMPVAAQSNEQLSQTAPSPEREPATSPERKKGRLSRRGLLAGAAGVAASLGIGAGVEYTIEHTGGTPGSQQAFTWDPATPLVGSASTRWLQVASLAQLRQGAVRFVTDEVVGYVVQLVKEHGAAGEVIALSAACTHMGCLVQWQDADRRFHCPCHAGLFEASGKQVNSPGRAHYLAPLPRFNIKIEQENVYVEVPAK
jgi:Rieske Fe-S protein